MDTKQELCKHSDKERAIVGTWWHVKLNRAIELGYKVLEVYEVHHFENTTKELFREFMFEFMKIKILILFTSTTMCVK